MDYVCDLKNIRFEEKERQLMKLVEPDRVVWKYEVWLIQIFIVFVNDKTSSFTCEVKSSPVITGVTDTSPRLLTKP